MVVLVSVAAASAGCQETGQKRRFFDLVESPTAHVEKIELLDSSDQALRLGVTLRLTNPNDVPLPMTIARYSVDVPGAGSYQGDQRPQATIRAEGEQVFVLTAAVPAGTANPALDTAVASGSVEYEPPGEFRMLLTESGVPLPSVAFRGSGELGETRP